jgi:hypothetical protein
MIRFQSNCIFAIYRSARQRKNINIDKKNIWISSLKKIVVNKFMITRDYIVSTMYIMLENKQKRKTYNLI